MRTLQRLIIPGLDVCPEIGMYLGLSGPATLDVEDRHVVMRRGGVLRTDTFFGVFSLGVWAHESVVEDLGVRFDVAGSFRVEIVVTSPDRVERVVTTSEVDATSGVVGVPALSTLGRGLLWIRITCESGEGRVRGVEIVTRDAPARDVHLGVAITTYNRMPYVAANVSRMARLFKEQPETADDVSVLIVDNARNLELAVHGDASVEVVPNPNLGGAGGFVRGLWEHRRRGRATHVLFMDDDVAFEPEILARTVALLRFARRADLCIAGSMMRMDRPQSSSRPAPIATPPPTTSGWRVGAARTCCTWTCCSPTSVSSPSTTGPGGTPRPLSITDAYPPPLFVRGDDVFWGLRHGSGRSITVNGIGVWSEDFEQKNGPTSAFYEWRNVPLITSLAYPSYTAAELHRRVASMAFRSISSFRYDWAEATLDGTEAFLDGPRGLPMAVDPTAVHVLSPAGLPDRGPARPGRGRDDAPRPEAAIALAALALRPLAMITLSGNLLPGFLRRRPPVVLYVQHRSVMAATFRDELLLRYQPTAEGITIRRDRACAFALLRRTRRVLKRVTREYDDVAADYRAAEPEMTSGAFWGAQVRRPRRAARSGVRLAIVVAVCADRDAISAAAVGQAALAAMLPAVESVDVFTEHIGRPLSVPGHLVRDPWTLLRHPAFRAADVAIFHWGIHARCSPDDPAPRR